MYVHFAQQKKIQVDPSMASHSLKETSLKKTYLFIVGL